MHMMFYFFWAGFSDGSTPVAQGVDAIWTLDARRAACQVDARRTVWLIDPLSSS